MEAKYVSANPERIQKLIRRLKHVDPVVRLHAGVALGDMGPAAVEAVPALLELLTGENVSDRKLAALALGYIGPAARGALPALTQALRDADEGVRRMAAVARERIETGADTTKVA
jgi:HEAT repeat protein